MNSAHKSNKAIGVGVSVKAFISGTPKEKTSISSSLNYISLNHLNYLANSTKSASKKSIDYSNTVNVNKKYFRLFTLFPIQEQMSKTTTNGITAYNHKTIDNTTTTNKESFKASGSDRLKSTTTIHSTNKLFQIKKHTHTHHYTSYNNKQYNNSSDRVNTYENIKPRRDLSLNKKLNTITNNDAKKGFLNYGYNKKNSMPNSYMKSKVAGNSNSINKHKAKTKVNVNNLRKPSIKHRPQISYTINIKAKTKQLIKQVKLVKANDNVNSSTKNNNTNTNLNCNTIANIDLNNYDINTKHSISLSNKIQLSLDNSTTDLSYQKEKQQIKVNRKKEKDKDKDSHNNSKTPTDNKPIYYKNTSLIKKYSDYLTQYEVKELKDFKSLIFYTHPFEVRLKNNIKYTNSINNTYSYTHFPNLIHCSQSLFKSKSHQYLYNETESDKYNDEEGNYILIRNEHIQYRYEILDSLGKGSFGEAIKCFDHKTKEYVCIKMMKSNPKLSLQAMSEVVILEYIKFHTKETQTNIVKYNSYFIFRNHLCIVFELLSINLYEQVKHNNYVGFDIKQIRQFAIDILFSLLFLKKNKIIHCDLKPENILLTSNTIDCNNVKLIDFGSSCFSKRNVYVYIQSRFYRAPEVILEHGYSYEIDMWSLGCILPELYTGVPIFPGEDERDQVVYIVEYLGMPSVEYLNKSKNKFSIMDNKGQLYVHPNRRGGNGGYKGLKSKSFNSFLKGAPGLFIDFVKKCLMWIPKDRMTPEDALMHEWINKEMTKSELDLHVKHIKQTCQ